MPLSQRRPLKFACAQRPQIRFEMSKLQAWGFNPRNPPPPATRPEAFDVLSLAHAAGASENAADSSLFCFSKPKQCRLSMCALKRMLLHSFYTFLAQSILRPFRARGGLGRFPGVETPGLSTYSPFGFGAKARSISQYPNLPGKRTSEFRNTLLRG